MKRAGETELIRGLAVVPKAPTPIQERLLTMPVQDEDEISIVYQHSVLCQTCMPYKDPGDGVRLWKRRNGMVRLELQAGRVMDPHTRDFIDIGLPFGAKPRLVLYHLNAEALRTRSPSVHVEDSLTAFVSRTVRLDPNGRNIRIIKDQLARLAAADLRLGATYGGHAITIRGTAIEELELWCPSDPSQKMLWPTFIKFSDNYFNSLMVHAVPLNEAAVVRLSHSAMALDLYTWLAQRLHRIKSGTPALLPWSAVQDQFGQGYDRMQDFKRFFARVLKQVYIVYPEARFLLDEKGMHLWNSPPPVTRKLISTDGPVQI